MRIASLWANAGAVHAADVFTRKFCHSDQSVKGTSLVVKSEEELQAGTPVKRRVQAIVRLKARRSLFRTHSAIGAIQAIG